MTEQLLGKAQNPSDEHPMGVSVDGAHIEPGLVVWTNEYRAGYVTDRLHRDGWFDVRYPNGSHVMQNPERVATAFEGKAAADELTRTVEMAGVTVHISPDPAGHVSIQIDTKPGTWINVALNDGDLFSGNPEEN